MLIGIRKEVELLLSQNTFSSLGELVKAIKDSYAHSRQGSCEFTIVAAGFVFPGKLSEVKIKSEIEGGGVLHLEGVTNLTTITHGANSYETKELKLPVLLELLSTGHINIRILGVFSEHVFLPLSN